MIPPSAWIDRGPCAACGSLRHRTERQIGPFPLGRCDDCGFLQTGRVLDAMALAGLYAEGYGGLRQQQGQEINARINLAVLGRLGLLDARLEKVLDVGCGYGFLLDRLAGRAVQRAGLELAVTEVAHARNVFGLDVATSFDGLGLDLQDGFDLIVMFEVLEHITDPAVFLASFVKRLRPGGVLVVGTDNFLSWPARMLGDHFPKWIPHQHVSLFDPAALERVMAGLAGMSTIARASYTPWELALRGFVYRLSGGRIGARHYDLDHELASENSRPFRLFALRRLLNRAFFGMAARRDLSGEMMFIAARKV